MTVVVCSITFDFLANYIIKLTLLFLVRLRPRILIDVTKVDLTTHVLGYRLSMPILVAPTAMQKMAHPEGENCIENYTADVARKYRSIGAVTLAILDNTCLTGALPHMCFLQTRLLVKGDSEMNLCG